MANPTIVVRVAFANNVMDLSPTWTDVSSTVQSLSIRRGRQHELDRIEAGTARIVLVNTSGNFWPDNTGGAYTPNVKPLKRVNIRVTYGATTYDEYTGFIESLQPDFVMKPAKLPIMVLNCVDIQKNLSNILMSEDMPQELSGARVGRIIMGWMGWPGASCTFDAGISYCQAQPDNSDGIYTNGMTHLYRVCDTEMGIIFQAGDGEVYFHDRHHRLTAAKSITSQATFGDGVSDLQWQSIYYSMDDLYVYNDLHATRIDGDEQIAQDSSSITKYGTRSKALTNLLNISDLECLDQANYLKARYKEPFSRVRRIDINGGSDPANIYPKILSLDISDRITVRLTPASVLSDYFIEAVTHDWRATKPGEWITSYQLTSCDSLSYWIWGTSKWGTGRWGY